jgi:hypothetical protein
MKCEVFSYRYAQEILEHGSNKAAWDEIIGVAGKAPLFIHPGKSSSNPKLDVVQQCLNTWFDRALAVDRGWDYHPLATGIPNSRLAADFRKRFPNIRVQAEVQFGNMSRWYSDIFKLQAAYSQELIDMGLSIVPMGSLARRIDSNVVSYERVVRELPAAKLSITLPILVIGIEPEADTKVVDLTQIAGLPLKTLTKREDKVKSSERNRYRLVEALRSGADPKGLTVDSPTGPMAHAIAEVAEDLD